MNKHGKKLVGIICVAALLQACNQQTDHAKVEADVAKAEAAAQKNVIDAQAKLDQVVAANNKDLVGAQADAQRDAANNTNAPPPEANAEIAKARSNAELKVADAQFDVDKAKAEGIQKIAEARCEDQVGEANKACTATAKANYDLAVAQAKAKNDLEHAAHK